MSDIYITTYIKLNLYSMYCKWNKRTKISYPKWFTLGHLLTTHIPCLMWKGSVVLKSYTVLGEYSSICRWWLLGRNIVSMLLIRIIQGSWQYGAFSKNGKIVSGLPRIIDTLSRMNKKKMCFIKYKTTTILKGTKKKNYVCAKIMSK